ncbi:MAG: DUF3108 domain-containing protein [Desulfobacterales bacterium]|jgi:hypothetical protein
MDENHENCRNLLSGLKMSRRECLRLFLGGLGAIPTLTFPSRTTASQTKHGTVIDQFLGEELFYQIGFWLFPHCGEAKTNFSRSDSKPLYRISLQGQTVGFYDLLLGRYRYSFLSYAEHSIQDDRLKPISFTMKKRHLGRESHRQATFDYKNQKIAFSQTASNGKVRQQVETMSKEMIYEDYLTLFYNFRHGHYGQLNRGRTFRLPLYVRKGMKPTELNIANLEQEQMQRREESNPAKKKYFLKFRVYREDVSSASGEVEGWLSNDAVPLKGTIKDVIFFGDLWGIIVNRRFNTNNNSWETCTCCH